MPVPIRGLLKIAANVGSGRQIKRKRDIETAERERDNEREDLRSLLSVADADLRLREHGGGVFDLGADVSATGLPGDEIGRTKVGGRTLSVRRDPTTGRVARNRAAIEAHEKEHPGEWGPTDPTSDEDFSGLLRGERVKAREAKETTERRLAETNRRVRNLMAADPKMTEARARARVEEDYDPDVAEENRARAKRDQILQEATTADIAQGRREREEDRRNKTLETEVSGVLDAFYARNPKATVDQGVIHLERMYGNRVSPTRRQGLAAGAIRRRDSGRRQTGSILDEALDLEPSGGEVPQARSPSAPARTQAPTRTAVPPKPDSARVVPPKSSGASARVGAGSGPVTKAELDRLIASGMTEEQITDIVAKRGSTGW